MINRSNQYVIIVAGGSGLRMKTDIPKQFLCLNGLPVLMHTIKAFYNYNNNINIILVIPENHAGYWKKLCNDFAFTINHTITFGGSERFYSVKNGLDCIKDLNSIVAVHDGVRPLVSIQTIALCFEQAAKKGNAIPAIPVNDSVRLIEQNNSKIIDRNNIRLIQTPQTFKTEILKKAYEQQFTTKFTDDASVIEMAGHTINLVEGNAENIKITREIDLVIASAFAEKTAR